MKTTTKTKLRTVKIEAMLGEHIDNFVKKMVAEWKKRTDDGYNEAMKGLIVEGDFNGVTLRATGKETAKDLSNYYDDASAKESAAYRKTDEYKEIQRKQKEEKSELQKQHDELMAELPKLDFKNHNKVLDFAVKYHEATDHIGVKKDHSIIIGALEKGGYVSGANTGEDYKENDEENSARYLIGQFMSCIKSMGACPGVLSSMYEQYKTKFK